MLDVSVDGLTIVVLTHELVHAYTQLENDIDNEQWETGAFAAADLKVVEGLAQFIRELCAKARPEARGIEDGHTGQRQADSVTVW